MQGQPGMPTRSQPLSETKPTKEDQPHREDHPSTRTQLPTAGLLLSEKKCIPAEALEILPSLSPIQSLSCQQRCLWPTTHACTPVSHAFTSLSLPTVSVSATEMKRICQVLVTNKGVTIPGDLPTGGLGCCHYSVTLCHLCHSRY